MYYFSTNTTNLPFLASAYLYSVRHGFVHFCPLAWPTQEGLQTTGALRGRRKRVCKLRGPCVADASRSANCGSLAWPTQEGLQAAGALRGRRKQVCKLREPCVADARGSASCGGLPASVTNNRKDVACHVFTLPPSFDTAASFFWGNCLCLLELYFIFTPKH